MTAKRVTRTAFTRRALSLCFFPLLTVVAGNFTLLKLPQARETLEAVQSFDSNAFWYDGPYWYFLLALAYWAFAAWYCARIMLGKRFPLDDIGHCVSPRYAWALVNWLPRVLGLMSCLPMTLYFALGDRPSGLYWLPLAVLSGAFLAFVVVRKKLFGVAGWEHRPGWAYPRFNELGTLAVLMIAAMVTVSWLLLLSIVVGKADAARAVGSPALLLAALGGWTLFGSIALMYIPKSRGWPALTLLPFAIALAASFSNENHLVAQSGASAAGAEHSAPDKLIADFRAWKDKHDASRPGQPIYLVASAGGASRAAYWTGAVLWQLENFARANGRSFAPNIYAMSGVSGGSLGLAAFAGALASQPGQQPAPLPRTMLDFLGQDFLAPAIGYMLYPDALARFSPVPCTACDRSRGLEESWAEDWRRLMPDDPAADWFRRKLPALKQGRDDLPHLILNSASVSDGKRVVQAGLDFLPPEAYDLLDKRLDTSRLTLAGAVHNSARFPYISPGGLVYVRSPKSEWDYLVDGGYFENSGVATINAILNRLKAEPGLLRPEDQVVVIVIENDPVWEHEWLCKGDKENICKHDASDAAADKANAVARQAPAGAAKGSGTGTGSDRASACPAAAKTPLLAEVTIPPLALYQSRNARAHAAEAEAIRILGGCTARRVVELRYPKVEGEKEPPMSWFLNAGSRKIMEKKLGGEHPDASQKAYLAFREQWQQMQRYIAPPAP